VTGKSALAPRDPLLAIVRIILGVSMVGMVVAAIAFILAVPMAFVWHDQAVAWIVGKGAPPWAIWVLVLLPLGSSVLAVLGFYFARHLYRIITSVAEGDPFVPANAERLRAMAWISVAVHVVAIPMSVIGNWAVNVTKDMHFKADVPLAGLFLALVLFILARVFREGTRMREDLEGTV
jgi:hypothetical protein